MKILNTRFKQMFGDNKGLPSVLCKENDNLGPHSVRKAQTGKGALNESTKFEIFVTLIEKQYIRFGQYTVHELFSLIDNED